MDLIFPTYNYELKFLENFQIPIKRTIKCVVYWKTKKGLTYSIQIYKQFYKYKKRVYLGAVKTARQHNALSSIFVQFSNIFYTWITFRFYLSISGVSQLQLRGQDAGKAET
jgi:hypothetical protein